MHGYADRSSLLILQSWEVWGRGGVGVWFSEPGAIPMLHTALALAILALIVIHVYMTGTGHFLFAHIKAMITGWGMWMGVSP